MNQEEQKYSEQDIIRKIDALLANAEGLKEDSPEAAASYAAKAQQLLQKFNLDRARIAKERGEKETTDVIMQNYHLPSTQRWRRELFIGCAGSNFCVTASYRDKRHQSIYGEPQNINAAIRIFEYLHHEIIELAKRAYVHTSVDYHTGLDFFVVSKNTWIHNFQKGATNEVLRRLAQQLRDVQASQNELRALVIVKSDAAEALRNKDTHGREGRATSYKFDSTIGYAEGVAAGSKIALNSPSIQIDEPN